MEKITMLDQLEKGPSTEYWAKLLTSGGIWHRLLLFSDLVYTTCHLLLGNVHIILPSEKANYSH